MRSSKQGFSAIEVILIVVVVALIGFVGFKFWEASQKSTANTEQSQQAADATKPIQSDKDLTTVSQQLDQTDVEGSFEKDLSTDSSFTSGQ